MWSHQTQICIILPCHLTSRASSKLTIFINLALDFKLKLWTVMNIYVIITFFPNNVQQKAIWYTHVFVFCFCFKAHLIFYQIQQGCFTGMVQSLLHKRHKGIALKCWTTFMADHCYLGMMTWIEMKNKFHDYSSMSTVLCSNASVGNTCGFVPPPASARL